MDEENLNQDKFKMSWSAADTEEDFIGPGSGHNSLDPEDLREHRSRISELWQAAGRCCRDNYYRRLSITSIVCGLSCIGAVALKYSVKAKETQRRDPALAAVYAQKARKLSIISIVMLFSILAAVPIFMALFSYLATLKD